MQKNEPFSATYERAKSSQEYCANFPIHPERQSASAKALQLV
jgi:hypothetical protein